MLINEILNNKIKNFIYKKNYNIIINNNIKKNNNKKIYNNYSF